MVCMVPVQCYPIKPTQPCSHTQQSVAAAIPQPTTDAPGQENTATSVPQSSTPASCHGTISVTQAPIVYPPKFTGLTYTYASYDEEKIPELAKNDHNCWSLCLEIPIPREIVKPTLTSLAYGIKYATTDDDGNSTVQVDTVLTTAPRKQGIIVDSADLGIYREKLGYGPGMLDEKSATSLSTVSAVKCNDRSAKRSYYVDHRRLSPNVRFTTEHGYLYLIFHVAEYATRATQRSLAVEVSATWCECPSDTKKREEAERKTKDVSVVADKQTQEHIDEVGRKAGT
jgi:hypothetical protein